VNDRDIKQSVGPVEKALYEKAKVAARERVGGEPSKALSRGSIFWKTDDNPLGKNEDGTMERDLTPCFVTGIGGDGSIRSDRTISYAHVKADGRLGFEHTMAPWLFDREVEQGRIGMIDAATWKIIVDLPGEWKKRLLDYRARDRARREAAIEDGTNPLNDVQPEHHPAYGVITLTRGSCGGKNLFGSAFKHSSVLTIRVNRASLHRSLSNDRTFAEALPIIEVDMSEAQFAHFVTSAAVGEGTPCSITYVAGQQMPDVPGVNEVERFHDDTKRTMKRAAKNIEDAINVVVASMEKPNLGKKDREAIIDHLFRVQKAFTDSVPFTIEQFGERMEKIVADGKQEIEAYVQHLTQRANALPAPPTLALTTGEAKPEEKP
jgi:hypothetical protein